MDRPDISRLNKNRSIYLKLGFVISLSLTVMAFNYTVYDDYEKPVTPVPMEVDELVQVQRTIQKKKPLPTPPVFKMTDNIVEPDPIEPVPEPIEPIIIPDPDPGPVDPSPGIVSKPIVQPTVVLPDEPVETAPPIFIIVEQMPRFDGCENQGLTDTEIKGCSDKRMLNFIYSNIKYPPIARDNGIEGTVVASFVVEKDGSLSGLKIVREIGGGCGNEVLRMIKKMPDWIAGEQRKRKVRVQFNLPVKFKLN